jgi:hypothetical protein
MRAELMTEAPKEKSPLSTVELTAEETRTLVVSLAVNIKRRTIHMHSAIDPKRAAIETELKSLQAVYDKVIAAEKGTADDSRSIAQLRRKATGGPPSKAGLT